MASVTARLFPHVRNNLTAFRIPSLRSRVLHLTTETQAKIEKNSTCTTKPTNSEKNESTETAINSKFPELSEIEKLTNEIKALNSTLTETQDKYLRSLAEVENVRRRMGKQVEEARTFGIQNFCKDLLDVADVLGKATTTVPQDALRDDNPHLRNLYEGLCMTETQLLGVFSRHGLVRISPLEGDTFDPHFHEAMYEIPTKTGGEESGGKVALLQKVGYKLQNRTIRPAQVAVYKQTE